MGRPKRNPTEGAASKATIGAKKAAIRRRVNGLKEIDLADIRGQIADLQAQIDELRRVEKIVLDLRGEGQAGTESGPATTSDPAAVMASVRGLLTGSRQPMQLYEIVKKLNFGNPDLLQKLIARDEQIEYGPRGYSVKE